MFDRWRAAIADESLRRDATDPDLDDRDWEPVAVPGHWRSEPAFADSDGPVLYRSHFVAPVGPPGTRTWVDLHGVFYTSDVWLDRSYLGDTEGYFVRHGFELTEGLAPAGPGAAHVLALEVACTPPGDRRHKRNLTGVFQHWDLIPADLNPGGIWRPVELTTTGPVRIAHSRVLCRDATAEGATLFVRLVLDSATTVNPTIAVRWGLRGEDRGEHLVTQPLATGENQVELTVAIDDPELWWPWSRGDQPRYDVEVAIEDVEGWDGPSDRVERRVGLRSVGVDRWIHTVNGERIHLKGANHGPTTALLAEATAEEVRGDVALAVDAGLDLLRVHAHIARPELYDAADEAGLLLWQDLPLQWGYHRSVRRQARRQARAAVDLLAHHPSVIVWCGHNEPLTLDVEPDAIADPRRRGGLAVRGLAQQLLPTWNKSVLDHSIKKVLETNDGSRPVVAHSGVLPHPPQLDGTDSHWYFGWYHGQMDGIADLVRRFPRGARFVSEFGAQAAPRVPPWAGRDDAEGDLGTWPDLDWRRLHHRYALQHPFFAVHVPPTDHGSYEDWAAATQAYQAELLRTHIEVLRRVKYRPSGGFALFCLADSTPGVTWSVLDHERRPKQGFDAVREACRPVIATVAPLPRVLHPGDALHLDVHAINDRPIGFPDMVCSVHLHWESLEVLDGPQAPPPLDGPLDGPVDGPSDGAVDRSADRPNDAPTDDRRRWTGQLPADSVVLVGTVAARVPGGVRNLVVDLRLEHPELGAPVERRYVRPVRT